MNIGTSTSASNEALDLDDPFPVGLPSVICPLCCDEDLTASPSLAVTLSACRHRSCRACLTRWVEREEAVGQTASPACPFCRATVAEEDVLAILGRPFRPGLADDADENEDNGTDDLTRQWIDENTVSCRACGSRIEKYGGCDLMECLCGYRFCYACGAPGGRCGCNNRGHIFANDNRYRNDCVPNAPIRDGNGRVDLRACIRRTEGVREQEREREREEMTRMLREFAQGFVLPPLTNRRERRRD